MTRADGSDASASDVGAFVPGPRVERAGAAAGPLAGLGFAVKDLIDVAGTVTGGGNPDWRRTHDAVAHDAPAVARLLAAGAALQGKTITDELAFSLEGANHHYGTPVNPRCPDRLPGGSSSGSAVAVAAGLVDFALGTDTGGSVRVPAGFCGLFGFRPSHGAVSLDGVLPFAPSYDTVGWFARDGETLQRVGQAMLDAAPAPPPQRLVVARDAFALCDPGCAAPLLAAALALGATDEAMVFEGGPTLWQEAYRVLQGREVWQSLGAWIEAVRPHFGPSIAARFADAAGISAALATQFAPLRLTLAAHVASLFPPGTGLVLPTAPGPAVKKSAPGEEIGRFYARALALTSIAGHAGLPQVSLPLVEVEGCPVGLSVVGARGDDAALLALAAAQLARR